MSTYYYLVNDTLKERVDFNSDVKRACFISNYVALNQAFMLYLFNHQGDSLRFMSDSSTDTFEDYKEIDLSELYKEELKELNLWQ